MEEWTFKQLVEWARKYLLDELANGNDFNESVFTICERVAAWRFALDRKEK